MSERKPICKRFMQGICNANDCKFFHPKQKQKQRQHPHHHQHQHQHPHQHPHQHQRQYERQHEYNEPNTYNTNVSHVSQPSQQIQQAPKLSAFEFMYQSAVKASARETESEARALDRAYAARERAACKQNTNTTTNTNTSTNTNVTINAVVIQPNIITRTPITPSITPSITPPITPSITPPIAPMAIPNANPGTFGAKLNSYIMPTFNKYKFQTWLGILPDDSCSLINIYSKLLNMSEDEILKHSIESNNLIIDIMALLGKGLTNKKWLKELYGRFLGESYKGIMSFNMKTIRELLTFALVQIYLNTSPDIVNVPNLANIAQLVCIYVCIMRIIGKLGIMIEISDFDTIENNYNSNMYDMFCN